MELMEIEKELAGPEGGSALERYDGILVNLAARAKSALDRGLEPDEFSRVSELAEAVTLARKLLRLQVQKR